MLFFYHEKEMFLHLKVLKILDNVDSYNYVSTLKNVDNSGQC